MPSSVTATPGAERAYDSGMAQIPKPKDEGDQDATERRWRKAFLRAYEATGNVEDACRRVQLEAAGKGGGRSPEEQGEETSPEEQGERASPEAGEHGCPVTPWWVARSKQRSETFARAYGHCRAALGTRSAERSLAIAEATVEGTVHPSAAAVAVKAHQWYASRAAREEWGDRVDGQLQLTGTVEHAGLGGELAGFIRQLLADRAAAEAVEPAALPDDVVGDVQRWPSGAQMEAGPQ